MLRTDGGSTDAIHEERVLVLAARHRRDRSLDVDDGGSSARDCVAHHDHTSVFHLQTSVVVADFVLILACGSLARRLPPPPLRRARDAHAAAAPLSCRCGTRRRTAAPATCMGAPGSGAPAVLAVGGRESRNFGTSSYSLGLEYSHSQRRRHCARLHGRRRQSSGRRQRLPVAAPPPPSPAAPPPSPTPPPPGSHRPQRDRPERRRPSG